MLSFHFSQSGEQVSGLPNHEASLFPFSTKVNCWDLYIPWGLGKGDIGMGQERDRGMNKEMGLVCPYWTPSHINLAVLTCHWFSCFWLRGKSSWWHILTKYHPFAQNLSCTDQSLVHTFFALIRMSLGNSEWQKDYGQRRVTITVTSKL